MPADEKVSRGQRFRPNAALHNTLVDVAASYRSSRMSGGLAGETDLSAIPQTIIRVRNDTGAMVGRGRILGLDEPLRDPDDGETLLRNDLVVKGVAPTSDHVHGKWCVTLEAIANGQIGEAIVAGVALVRLSLLNADHTHAECATSGGETTRYAVSAEHGSARILWTGGTPDEDDLQLALVRLGDYQKHVSWLVSGIGQDVLIDVSIETPVTSIELRLGTDVQQFGGDWEVTTAHTLTCQRTGWYRILLTQFVASVAVVGPFNGIGFVTLRVYTDGGTADASYEPHTELESPSLLVTNPRPAGSLLQLWPRTQAVHIGGAIWVQAGETLHATCVASSPQMSEGTMSGEWVGSLYDWGHKLLLEWIGNEPSDWVDGPFTTTTAPPPTTTTEGPTTTTTQPCPGYGTCAELTPNTWLAKCIGGAWVVLCDTCDPGLVADTSGCTAPCTEGACCAGSCGPGPTTTTTSPPPTTTTAGPTTTTTPAGCVSSEVCGYEWDGMQWVGVSSCIAGVCCQGACECCPPETSGMYYGQTATGTCMPTGTCGGGPPATTTMMPPPPP